MDAKYIRILIGIGAAVVVLLGALVVVVLAGGGDDEGETASTIAAATVAPSATTTAPTATTAPTPVTTAPPPATTAAPTATTAPPPVTTAPPPVTTAAPPATTAAPLPGPDCAFQPAQMPASATMVSDVTGGDYNGDGHGDTFVVYEDSGSFWARMEFANGYATNIQFDGFEAGAAGFGDIGYGGGQVAIARVDRGASTEVMGFFFFEGCGVWPLHLDTGGFYTFLTGGSVMYTHGLTCFPGGVREEMSEADPANPDNWTVYHNEYWLVPGSAGAIDLQHAGTTTTPASLPADEDFIFSSSGLKC